MKTVSSIKALLILVFTFGIAQSSFGEQRREIELLQVESLLKEILMFSGKNEVGKPKGVADAEENFDYNVGGNCTKDQSDSLHKANMALIKGFLSKPNIAPKKIPLNETDIQKLNAFLTGIPRSLEGTSNDACDNQITLLRNSFKFFNVLYSNNGFFVDTNAYTFGKISSKLLTFGHYHELTRALAGIILTYNSIRLGNPSLENDSGFGIFLVSKFYDYGTEILGSDNDKKIAAFNKVSLQYRIYHSILTTALKTQKPDILDSLIAYSELTKIMKSERAPLERFRTKAYVSTLLKIAESFNDLAKSPKILNQVALGEEITSKAIEQGLGSRENIMSFVVIELEGIDNSDHMKVFNEVSLEMKKGIWNSKERKLERNYANLPENQLRVMRIETAAKILRITQDIIKLAPRDLNKALALCKNVKDQYSKGKRELVDIVVNETPKQKSI